MKPGYVYRAFDAAGELLYIGCTIKPSSRFTQHQSEKDWWPEVASITLECHESREAALSVERVAIAKERPRLNRRIDSSLLSLDEAREHAARRAAEREARDERRERERDAMYNPEGVLCGNCGSRPAWLPKGVLIVEMDCPACGCRTLAMVEQAA